MNKRSGFFGREGVTFIEMMIILVLFMILAGIILWAVRGQTGKGLDAQRKKDLEVLRVAFEEYFNDNGCYPNINILANCDSHDLRPYLPFVPCDPATNEPYVGLAGVPIAGACNNWFRIYTVLSYTSDPAIETLGLGDGFEIDDIIYNYGVSSPNVAIGSENAPTFVCPSGQTAPYTTSCVNPYDLVGICGTCDCAAAQRIVQGPSGDYYCCPDDSCH